MKIKKISSILLIITLLSSFSTNSAPIWGPWQYHSEDRTYLAAVGFVKRCWYVRYKITDPNYRDALRSSILNKYQNECPANPPFS